MTRYEWIASIAIVVCAVMPGRAMINFQRRYHLAACEAGAVTGLPGGGDGLAGRCIASRSARYPTIRACSPTRAVARGYAECGR